MKWSQAWNKKRGKKIVDPAVYRSVQPIYTMERVIELPSVDPIDKKDFIGHVSKGDPLLKWMPKNIEEVSKPVKGESGAETKIVDLNLNKKTDYEIGDSIKSILTSENYHDQIRSTALSLINKNVTPKDTRLFIEEFMLVAKNALRGDDERLADWQVRFDDIPRAIESAKSIVGVPDFDEVISWIGSDPEDLRLRFPQKIMSFEGVELRLLIKEIDLKTGFGTRAISDNIKKAKLEKALELADIARKIRSEERRSQNIFEIEVANSNHGEAIVSACKILSKSTKKPEVYKIGNALSVVESSSPKTIRQIATKKRLADDYPMMPIIHDITNPVGVLRSRVEKDCVFVNETGKEIVCPDSILNAIPKMYGVEWNPLSGIVEHPFINDEWELVTKDGYDSGTGLYSVLHKKLKIELIDPKVAYDYLANEVLAEFPFQTKTDVATAIGMFMTAVQRPYVIGDSGMPGFAIVSPKPSSGKTTLAQLLSYSVYNRPVAATGWSDSEEELGKHLLAILREGHSCVLFDNIKKDASIQSNELAKAMTSGTYSRRKLGSNETEEVPSSALWLFTGNNILFRGDFATRILPIRIVPKTERPESRKFDRGNIGKWAMDNRKKILSAILSVVMAGKDVDDSGPDSSRFKEWNKFVRLPILEVSGIDLLEVFSMNNFMDDEAVAKGDFLQMLRKSFGDNPFLTKDIIQLAKGVKVKGSSVAVDSNGEEVSHIIESAFSEKATTNIKTLGRHVLGMKDFIMGGLMLIREEGRPPAKWRVVVMDDESFKEENDV